MKKWLIRALVLMAVILLGGCGSGSQTGGQTDGKNSSPTVVRLGYFANITHAQALIGVARGDFQKAIGSAQLKTSVFNAGPSAIEAIFAGELDITYIGPGPSVNAYLKSRGEAVRVVGGAAANGVVIVARKDSGIKTLADLKGKRIATPQYGNTQDIAMRAYMMHALNDKEKSAGGTTEIQPINNAEQIGLFKQGQLDASWSPEPWASRLIHEAGGVAIEEEKNLWDGKRFSITLLLVSKAFLDAHPDTVEALLRANEDLTEFLKKSPDEAATIINGEIKRLSGKALDPAILKEALTRVEFTSDPIESSVMKFSEWNRELGFSKEKADVNGLFDLAILKKVRGEQGAKKPSK